MRNYSSNLAQRIVGTLVVILTTLSVQAQQPILVHNQDTTYFLENPTLPTITVTASRVPSHSSLEQVTQSSALNTSFSRVTKDLKQDIPSIIRLYTPQGVPMLTKYTSNNSLTSTIPDSAISLELKELGAKYPNPDAPVIIQPNYHRSGDLSLSLLNQTLFLGTDDEKAMTGLLALSHSGAANFFENLIPELHGFNTTLAGYGGFRADYGSDQVEVILRHSKSSNEYSQQLNVKEFKETDHSTNIFINYSVGLGNKTLQTSISHQTGQSHRKVKETNLNYEVINEIEANTYTIALNNSHTELRANYYDFFRVYPYGRVQTIHQQRLETFFSHKLEIFKKSKLSLEARFDHHDNEPSINSTLQVPIFENLFATINGGRLFDAIGSEGLNNLMESVQMAPHPWTVTYGMIDTDLHLGTTKLSSTIAHKKLHRGWYGESAYTQGWIMRLRASGKFSTTNSNNYLKWNVGGTIRDLSLDIAQKSSRVMPGIARIGSNAKIEANFKNMIYAIQVDTFIGRKIRLARNISSELGPLHFLSFEMKRIMGDWDLKASFNNVLALFGKKNNILAHYNESEGTSFVQAPPIFDISLGINLY